MEFDGCFCKHLGVVAEAGQMPSKPPADAQENRPDQGSMPCGSNRGIIQP